MGGLFYVQMGRNSYGHRDIQGIGDGWECATRVLLKTWNQQLGLRVAHVKRKTLNAFFGHSRSFAHPKTYIQNDRRDEIYNPSTFDF